jgi:hypothetical protein
MDTKTKQDSLNTQLGVDKQIEGMLKESKAKLGLFDTWALKGEESKRAKDHISAIGDALAESKKNMAITAINIAEANTRSALVAGSVDTTGALLRQVNESTTAAQQAISNSATAEMASIFANKNRRWDEVGTLVSSGQLTPEEGQATKSLAEYLANDDVGRSLERAKSSKNALASIADHATRGIEQSIDRLR